MRSGVLAHINAYPKARPEDNTVAWTMPEVDVRDPVTLERTNVGVNEVDPVMLTVV